MCPIHCRGCMQAIIVPVGHVRCALYTKSVYMDITGPDKDRHPNYCPLGKHRMFKPNAIDPPPKFEFESKNKSWTIERERSDGLILTGQFIGTVEEVNKKYHGMPGVSICEN